MTTRISIRAQNRKDKMARDLAVLIIGIGGGLIGTSWLLHTSTNTPHPLSTQQAQAEEAAPPAPAILPTKPPSIASTQDKPQPEATAVIPVNANTAWPASSPDTPPTATTLATTNASPLTPAPASTADKPTEPASAGADTQTGWIYAGQFIDGAWLERGLVIGDELPVSGQSYALNWGANIRSQPPGKSAELSENVGYLAQGHNVKIVQVKKSGSKGHVWLEIKR